MKMKKGLIYGSILTLAMSTVAGCSSSEKKPVSEAATPEQGQDGRPMEGNVYLTGLPIVKDKYSFSIFMPGDTSLDEKEAYLKIEEATNVDVQWDMQPWASVNEKKNLMFSSGDYADVIASWVLQETEIMKYGPKGVFIPLEDLIDKYTINIKKMFEDVPEARKAVTTPDGHIYTIPLVQQQANTKAVLHINKQWLDKLSLDMPTTTDELYEVLKAFKNNDPNGNNKKDEVPLSFEINGPNNNQFGFFGFFGRVDTPNHLAVEDGKVLYTAVQPEWKEAVKWFNKLWNEGLLDLEVFTHDTDQWKAKGRQNPPIYGVTSDWDGVESLGEENFKQYGILLPVTAPNVEQAEWPQPDPDVYRAQFAITSAAEQPAAILRWLDQLFPAITEEGLNETLYGKEGEGWIKTEDGKFKALAVSEDQAEYAKITGFPNYWPFDLSKKTEGVYMGPNAVAGENYKLYTLAEAYAPFLTKNPFPPIWLTPEQQNEVSTIQTDIQKATDERFARWVTGEGDIEADWDRFQKDLEKMGLSKLIAIYQEAVDAYNRL
ncbi:extracellular solute-binding protein [Bacillus sp. FJAT-28004]|uniref:extracellular solute-binding protein n=1 Tax=Bacillus sp. FJAT-28004 TaxID=1679165 RepID=UPI0006B68DBC|nr:extracellular solute-binding protein [Bacillus sp. FJAT-28004]